MLLRLVSMHLVVTEMGCNIDCTVSLGPTQADIRREISEEESKEAAKPGYVPLHDVSPAGFISMGLDLEEQQ